MNPIKNFFSSLKCCRERVEPNLIIERAKETPDLSAVNLNYNNCYYDMSDIDLIPVTSVDAEEPGIYP